MALLIFLLFSFLVSFDDALVQFPLMMLWQETLLYIFFNSKEEHAAVFSMWPTANFVSSNNFLLMFTLESINLVSCTQ